jgi:hypothetical protein
LLGAAGGFASDAIGLTGGAGSGGLDASMLDPANLGQFTNTAGLPTELTAHLGETIPGTSSTFAQALQAGAWSPDLTKVFSEVANVPLEQASQVEQAAQSGFQLDQNMLDATNPANLPAVPTDPALQPGSIPSIGTAGTLTGTAGGGMLDNIVSGAKDLVGGGSNLNSLVNAGTGLLGGYLNRNAEVDATEAQAKAQAEARAASEAYAAKIDATQQERLKLQNEKLAVANSGMGEADKQLMLSQIAAKEQSMMNDITTGGMAAQYDADARRKQAASLSAAGASAAAMAQFTPYGIKNNFGSSDTAGNTTLDPRFQSQFDQLYGQSQTALNQAGNVFGQTAPMAGASQSMFQLGQGYLATSPQAQAQKYMDEQMALYGAADERSLAALESKLSSRGRLGFAAGGTTTGMNAANPEMEAYYNAQKQRDLQLAANATQGGQQYAQFGVNMMGAGAKNLQDMYATQSAAYNPYNTAMAGMTGLQGEVQKNAAFGADLGQRRAQAGANAGQLMLSGATQAAQVQYQADQNAAQYAAYQEAQRAALAAMTPLERARAEAQAGYNSAGRTYDTANSQAADLSKSAANIPAASYVINAAPTAPANSPAGNMLTGVANQNYGWYGTGP